MRLRVDCIVSDIEKGDVVWYFWSRFCYTEYVVDKIMREKHRFYAVDKDREIRFNIKKLRKVMPKSSIMLSQEQCAESYLE